MDMIPRLLIIDDSAYICHMIEQIFSSENIELRKANDGAHALQAVTAFAPDLILLDVVLPDMSFIIKSRKLIKTMPL